MIGAQVGTPVLEPIRVIFIDMPKLVRQMLRQAVAADPHLVIEGEVDESADALELLEAVEGGVVLVGDGQLGEQAIVELLRRAPASVLLAVHANGDGLDLCELQPQRFALGQASPQQVVDLIRSIGSARGFG
jgi:DNA-binding NarL/FixJ family response regulator